MYIGSMIDASVFLNPYDSWFVGFMSCVLDPYRDGFKEAGSLSCALAIHRFGVLTLCHLFSS